LFGQLRHGGDSVLVVARQKDDPVPLGGSISTAYVDVAIERWETITGQVARQESANGL
jgi:hypothetical protein